MSNYRRKLDSTYIGSLQTSANKANLPFITSPKSSFPMTPPNDRSKSYMCQKDIESHYKVLQQTSQQNNFLNQIKSTKSKPQKLTKISHTTDKKRNVFTPELRELEVGGFIPATRNLNERFVSTSLDVTQRLSQLKKPEIQLKLADKNQKSSSFFIETEDYLKEYFPKRQDDFLKKKFMTITHSPGELISAQDVKSESITRIDFNTLHLQKDQLLNQYGQKPVQTQLKRKKLHGASPLRNKEIENRTSSLVAQSLNVSSRIPQIQTKIDPMKQSQLEKNLAKSLMRPVSNNLSRKSGPSDRYAIQRSTLSVDRYQTEISDNYNNSLFLPHHSSMAQRKDNYLLDQSIMSPKLSLVKPSNQNVTEIDFQQPFPHQSIDMSVATPMSTNQSRAFQFDRKPQQTHQNDDRTSPNYLKFRNYQAGHGLNAAKLYVSMDSKTHLSTHTSRMKTMQRISMSKDYQRNIQDILNNSSIDQQSLNQRYFQRANGTNFGLLSPNSRNQQVLTVLDSGSSTPEGSIEQMQTTRRVLNQSVDGVQIFNEVQSAQQSIDSNDQPLRMCDSLEIDNLDFNIAPNQQSQESRFQQEFDQVNDAQKEIDNRMKNFFRSEQNKQLFDNARTTTKQKEEKMIEIQMRDMQLKAKFSNKEKVNELIVGLITHDATKKGNNSEQEKGLKEIFSMMDQRQKEVQEGKDLEFSKKEMKKMLKNLDFMRKMTEEKRLLFSERLKQLIDNFEANTESIVQGTLDQIRILKSYIDDVNMSMGNIQVLSSLVKDKEYNKNNSVLLEMLNFQKADPKFTNQLEEAAPQTRVFINELMKSLEEDTPEEKRAQSAAKLEDVESQKSLEKFRRRPSVVDERRHTRKTIMRIEEQTVMDKIDEVDDHCESPKWDSDNDVNSKFSLPNNFLKDSPSKLKLTIQNNQINQFENSDQLTQGLRNKFSLFVQQQERQDNVFNTLNLGSLQSKTKNFRHQLFTNKGRTQSLQLEIPKARKFNKISINNSVNLEIKETKTAKRMGQGDNTVGRLSPGRKLRSDSSSNSEQTQTFSQGDFSNFSKSSVPKSRRGDHTVGVSSPGRDSGIDGGVGNRNISGGYSLIRKDQKKFGPACQKFREIVQKHFLTKSLAQLEEMDAGNISINMLLLLGELKSALDEILPEASTHTMGEKYRFIDKNLYANEFLQNLLSDVPGYGDKLNLKQSKKMALQLIAEEKVEMENMEKSQLDFIDEQQSRIDDMQSKFGQPLNNTQESMSELSMVEAKEEPPSAVPKSVFSPMRFGRKSKLGDDDQASQFGSAMTKTEMHVNKLANIQKQRRMLKQNTSDNLTLNQLFLQQTDKTAFYDMAKKKHIKGKEEDDLGKVAMRQYYKRCSDKQIKAQPFFVSFCENTLFLSQESVSLDHGKALNEYLEMVRTIKQKVIYKLVIDQCSMKDEVFAEILDGCFKQCQMMKDGSIEVQYLTTLVYTSNEFGPKSLAIMTKLLPGFVDFTFSTISEKGGFTRDIMCDIMKTISLKCKKLIKIKISNINLNHRDMVNGICTILKKSKMLQAIDFSWASLSPKSLSLISKNFEQRLKSLRSINMSYNQANMAEWQEQGNLKENFVDNLITFLENAVVCNHLRLSGMGLRQDQVIKICEQAIKCPLMLALHLNDNNITSDNQYFLKVLDIFAMGEEDLLDTNRSIKNQRLIQPKIKSVSLSYNNQHEIDYKTVMRVYMGFQSQRFVDKSKFKEDEALQVQRKIYKDHILLGKNQKIVDNMKAINTTQVSQGIGKLDDNEVDHLVISRIVNYPELIFNQRIKNDTSKQYKFFQKDAGMKWALSKSNECYVCQKHRYTMIFYEKGMLSNNQGLTEVHDAQFLNQLRADFQKNYINYQSTTPLICGTIINKQKGMPQFHRKLKMIRASLFTLMCISGSKIFISEKYQTHKLKNGCIRYLDFDNVEVLEGMSIKEKLDGWQHILDDKCNYNELTDVTRVNAPTFEHEIHRKDYYVFAGFLNPGYHQILIYDPELDRAFVKDFIVGINTKDFYPEFPLLHGAKSIKTVQNVWRNWVDDTQEDCLRSFRLDTQSNDEFDLGIFIRKPQDVKGCLEVMLENFNIIKIYQKELLVGSKTYPQVDFNRVSSFFYWIHANTLIPKSHKLDPLKAILENQFIRATRNDETSSLQSALQRMELYDFLIRIAQQWSYQVYSAKDMVSEHLQEFFDLYLKPIVLESQVQKQRQSMRSSSKLNELLFDNIKGLEVIFDENKENNYFTQDSAVKLMMKHPELMKSLDVMTIQKQFIFSQMTVLNEQKSLKRYGYLEFVEFLDMMCRLAKVTTKFTDTYENTVYDMLSFIYEDRYKAGIWSRDDWPLHEVNDDVDC